MILLTKVFNWQFKSLLCAMLVLMVTSSCSIDHSSEQSPQAEQPQLALLLPRNIPVALLPAGGTYSASVSSPCVAGGASQTLNNNGSNVFTGSYPGIPVGTNCVFNIIFNYDDPDFGMVQLVTGMKSITVNSTGSNPLTFDETEDYDRIDSDNDGVDNIAELLAQTDPLKSPVWGEMVWGQEMWTSTN